MLLTSPMIASAVLLMIRAMRGMTMSGWSADKPVCPVRTEDQSPGADAFLSRMSQGQILPGAPSARSTVLRRRYSSDPVLVIDHPAEIDRARFV
jgi:hypothetical protein